MSSPNPFITGGPVLPNSRVYIKREADRDAAQRLQKMDYIALIEPHQQGKTSLIGNLMEMFSHDRGYCWVYVDLSSWSSPMQPAEWNAALKDRILKRIQGNCPVLFQILDPPTSHLKWFDFLEALGKRAAAMGVKLVIAFDEIGTIPLECALGFFQPMRAVYNHRISQRHFNHLSFIISCAYNPALLEKDSPCSHFLNSCQRIDIDDFTLNQVKQLVEHIPNLAAEARKEIANRIFFWVDGHPFLTQWLCASLLKDRLPPTSGGVDSTVHKFQQNDIEHWPNIARKLSIYSDLREEAARILRGNQIAFAPSSNDEIRALELMGLVKADSQNYCKIRNRLYERLLEEQLGQLKTKPPKKGSKKGMATIEDFDRIKARITALQGELDTIEAKFEDGELDMDNYLRLRRRSITQRERELAALQRLLSESGVSEMDPVLEKLKTDKPNEAEVKQNLEQAAAQAEQKGWGQRLLEQIEAHKGDIVELAVAIAVQVGKVAVGLL
jgi:hypothetical protein